MKSIQEFNKTIDNINLIGKLVVAISIGIASLSALSPIAPPWPNQISQAILCATISMFAIVVAFLKETASKVRALILANFFIFVLLMGIYLIVRALFVYDSNITQTTIVKGAWCSDKANLIYSLSKRCPFLNETDFLGQDYDLDFFYSPVSIVAIEIFLLFIWICMSFIASYCLGLFASSIKEQLNHIDSP